MSVHRISRILQPKIITPPGKTRRADITSQSQKLLYDLGIIHSINNGTNALLPLAVRSFEKLKKIIRTEMNNISASEISLPALTSFSLFKTSGRENLPELFTLKDRHDKKYVLSPTHEEAITNMLSSIEITEKQLPLLLYQINRKFRDEIKPRFGMIRSREFLMKDLYCFDETLEKSIILYEKVNKSYHNILSKLKVPYCCVEGSNGEIGGTTSHEFHILSNIGEDRVFRCSHCKSFESVELAPNSTTCTRCNNSDIQTFNAIEVAHSFLLGTKYSLPLKAVYKTSERTQRTLEMSCHGIGVSRLLAAGVESLSSPDEIRWPMNTAPFSVCIIPPKVGSKEEKTVISTEELYGITVKLFEDDVVIDDRSELTIGKRLKDAKQMGYPLILVIGKSSILDTPLIEIHELDVESFRHAHMSQLSDVLSNKF